MFSRASISEFIKNHSFKGRQKAFNFEKDAVEQYVDWAFTNDYLIAIQENNEISSLLVVYPIKDNPIKTFDLLPSDDSVQSNSICLMDFIANTKLSRQKMTQYFMKKHPNWRNQHKWAIRNDKISCLSNQYIELVGGVL